MEIERKTLIFATALHGDARLAEGRLLIIDCLAEGAQNVLADPTDGSLTLRLGVTCHSA